MKASEIQFAANLEALSIPQCRRIVEALTQGSMTLADLSKISKLTPASIEKHLEILTTAGLVKLRVTNGTQKAHLQILKLEPTVDWFSKLQL
ncbi:MAG: hypothetical protein RLZZ295_233 [Actinomycetota bacterium]|jgi:DNA-binding transcriptional ArsR family regulator